MTSVKSQEEELISTNRLPNSLNGEVQRHNPNCLTIRYYLSYSEAVGWFARLHHRSKAERLHVRTETVCDIVCPVLYVVRPNLADFDPPY